MSSQNQQSSTVQGGLPSEHLKELSDIKRIMERSSRFISLSGLSGIAAGLCALGGAYIAYRILKGYYAVYNNGTFPNFIPGFDQEQFIELKSKLMLLAAGVLVAALLIAFFFTWRRARQNHLPLWDLTTRKLTWNVTIPLAAGGFFILGMLKYNHWEFVAPACLVFYGLALVNGSKYTLSDIRYLGYLEIVLGLVNMQFPKSGLIFWAVGFGVLHIIYGAIMWWKYERTG